MSSRPFNRDLPTTVLCPLFCITAFTTYDLRHMSERLPFMLFRRSVADLYLLMLILW